MQILTASLETLSKDYVLVQAFKKTVSYIRSHNWFADVLELDLATVDYPSFLASIQKDLSTPKIWTAGKARLVPAPKSSNWWINADSKCPSENAAEPTDSRRPCG